MHVGVSLLLLEDSNSTTSQPLVVDFCGHSFRLSYTLLLQKHRMHGHDPILQVDFESCPSHFFLVIGRLTVNYY